MQGLTPSLQAVIRRFCPQGIIQVMDISQWLEESEETIASERVFPARTKSDYPMNTLTIGNSSAGPMSSDYMTNIMTRVKMVKLNQI